MGSLRLTLCAVVAVAAALAPTAHAADERGVWLTPAIPTPGTDVRLSVRGCAGTSGTAVSDAFVADTRLVGEDGTLTGDTRIRSSSTVGPHAVTVDCDGQEIKGMITVAGPSAPPSPAATAAPSASVSAQAFPTTTATPSAPSSPTAPVQAGGGGTSNASPSDARVAAPGTWHAVFGLLLAGVAFAAVVARGVRRSRDTE
ncbi:hypothetical protein BX257_3553 [Streptomyces sp. 3212.3]|uniref:hypothetical protein n=1 Tax=Streptomyces sp. 3212.3 TaxID=1938846 RepID=UPI000E2410A2|nr:hypothetical protein [Streptomyces sp. 3212.3]REE60992.1 hypothetical protein BX257_3553 [Streptomyces sp. 3212.3]